MKVSTIVRALLCSGVSLGAIGLAFGLVPEGAHLPLGERSLLVGGAVIATTFGFHLFSLVIAELIGDASEKVGRTVEALSRNEKVDLNEDVERLGRYVAMQAARVAATYYERGAAANFWHHDPSQARALRRGIYRWTASVMRATKRRHQPIDEAWLRPGLSASSVQWPSHDADPDDPCVRFAEEAAWAELTGAMAKRGVTVPDGFRPYWEGRPNCGPGWRAAGHVLFMEGLKINHRAFVGFLVESLTRMDRRLANLERPVPRSHPPAPTAPPAPVRGLSFPFGKGKRRRR